MKILYVVSRSPEINSSASIRNSGIIQGLRDVGYDVTLLTTLPDKKSLSYDGSLLPNDIEVKYLARNKSSSDILTWAKRSRLLIPLKVIVGKHLYSKEIYDSQKWIVEKIGEVDFNKYDCIISSSDPKSSHLFMYEAVCKYGKMNWIQIWGDPFLGDISIPDGVDKEKLYNEEKKLLKYASHVYYVSQPTLKLQRDNYPEYAEKMDYIPIPYLKKKIYNITPLSERKKVEVCYCGDYPSTYRNLLPLYEAVDGMEQVWLKICGMTDIKLNDTERISVLPRQPHDVVERIEEKADILIHVCNTTGGQIPGKIYQYSGTNKPILFILDGEKELHRNQFEGYGRYVFCDNNKHEIMEGIKQIISSSKSYFPVEDFSKDKIVKKLKLS